MNRCWSPKMLSPKRSNSLSKIVNNCLFSESVKSYNLGHDLLFWRSSSKFFLVNELCYKREPVRPGKYSNNGWWAQSISVVFLCFLYFFSLLLFCVTWSLILLQPSRWLRRWLSRNVIYEAVLKSFGLIFCFHHDLGYLPHYRLASHSQSYMAHLSWQYSKSKAPLSNRHEEETQRATVFPKGFVKIYLLSFYKQNMKAKFW